MTSNHEDTNDLLQEIFAKAYRSITGFRGNSSFYTWMHSIAVNMTINFLKKRGRRQGMSLDDIDSNIQNDPEFIEITSGNDPRHEANLSELQQRLNEAMQKLSHEHRAVVTMFDIQGCRTRKSPRCSDIGRDRSLTTVLRTTASCKITWNSLSNADHRHGRKS